MLNKGVSKETIIESEKKNPKTLPKVAEGDKLLEDSLMDGMTQ